MWKHTQRLHRYDLSKFSVRSLCFSINQKWIFQCPVFDDTVNHHILAHIIRRIAHFSDVEHQEIILVLKTWEKQTNWIFFIKFSKSFAKFRLPVDLFRSAVQRLQTFVSINLFPARVDSKASTLVNGWWIPCAIRTLALFSK